MPDSHPDLASQRPESRSLRSGWWTFGALAMLVSCSQPAQQELPPPLRGGPPSDVPVEVQLQRWHMLDSKVSSRTFRSMDSLFTTRTVARSGPVWTLPRRDAPLSFTYTWQGSTLPAEQFLERTHTNALWQTATATRWKRRSRVTSRNWRARASMPRCAISAAWAR